MNQKYHFSANTNKFFNLSNVWNLCQIWICSSNHRFEEYQWRDSRVAEPCIICIYILNTGNFWNENIQLSEKVSFWLIIMNNAYQSSDMHGEEN